MSESGRIEDLQALWRRNKVIQLHERRASKWLVDNGIVSKEVMRRCDQKLCLNCGAPPRGTTLLCHDCHMLRRAHAGLTHLYLVLNEHFDAVHGVEADDE